MEKEKPNLVRLGNMITQINGCDFDRKSGSSGLFEKFVQLTPQEALNGKAIRKCDGQEAEIAVEVDENGYCSANCITTSCEFNSERSS